jgi:hypothetical protein
MVSELAPPDDVPRRHGAYLGRFDVGDHNPSELRLQRIPHHEPYSPLPVHHPVAIATCPTLPFLARRAHTPLAQRQNLGDKVGLIFRTPTAHLAIRNYTSCLSNTEPLASYAKPIIAASQA